MLAAPVPASRHLALRIFASAHPARRQKARSHRRKLDQSVFVDVAGNRITESCARTPRVVRSQLPTHCPLGLAQSSSRRCRVISAACTSGKWRDDPSKTIEGEGRSAHFMLTSGRCFHVVRVRFRLVSRRVTEEECGGPGGGGHAGRPRRQSLQRPLGECLHIPAKPADSRQRGSQRGQRFRAARLRRRRTPADKRTSICFPQGREGGYARLPSDVGLTCVHSGPAWAQPLADACRNHRAIIGPSSVDVNRNSHRLLGQGAACRYLRHSLHRSARVPHQHGAGRTHFRPTTGHRQELGNDATASTDALAPDGGHT